MEREIWGRAQTLGVCSGVGAPPGSLGKLLRAGAPTVCIFVVIGNHAEVSSGHWRATASRGHVCLWPYEQVWCSVQADWHRHKLPSAAEQSSKKVRVQWTPQTPAGWQGQIGGTVSDTVLQCGVAWVASAIATRHGTIHGPHWSGRGSRRTCRTGRR